VVLYGVQEDVDNLGSAADAILFDGTDSWLPEPTSVPSSSAAAVTSSVRSSVRGGHVTSDRSTLRTSPTRTHLQRLSVLPPLSLSLSLSLSVTLYTTIQYSKQVYSTCIQELVDIQLRLLHRL